MDGAISIYRVIPRAGGGGESEHEAGVPLRQLENSLNIQALSEAAYTYVHGPPDVCLRRCDVDRATRAEMKIAA